MKRVIGIGLALLLIFLFSASCGGGGGVAQDKYDKVNADLTAAQSQIEQLQEDLTAADAALNAANAKLTQAKGVMEFVNGFILPFIYGQYAEMGKPEMISLLSDWKEKTNAIGDAVLTQKIQAIIDAASAAGETDPGTGKALIEDLFAYTLGKLSEILK